MPRRKRKSESSPEERQINSEETVISTLVEHSQPNSELWVEARSSFLNLLRAVGAKGQQSSNGEIFSINDLGFYLKKYIREKQLWDPYNPLVVYCDKDPLGSVFGVSSFTLADARNLLIKNTVPVGVRRRSSPRIEISVDKKEENALDYEDPVVKKARTLSPISSCNQISSTVETPGKCTDGQRNSPTSVQFQNSLDSISIHFARKTPSPPGKEAGHKSPTEHNRDSQSSNANLDSTWISKRNRSPSFSIIYDDDNSSPWYFQVDLPYSTDSEIYSVQSKVTEMVHSSFDEEVDWFVDEQITTYDRLSIEIQSRNESDPPFNEEYEVRSDSGSSVDDQDIDSATDDDIYLIAKDSDIEFWADSESSNEESEITTSDSDISKLEKWKCKSCELLNTPVRSRCERCWEVRPGWIEGSRYPKKKKVPTATLR